MQKNAETINLNQENITILPFLRQRDRKEKKSLTTAVSTDFYFYICLVLFFSCLHFEIFQAKTYFLTSVVKGKNIKGLTT